MQKCAAAIRARCRAYCIAGVAALACGPRAVPDARSVAERWAEAVRAGDAATLHALLTSEARTALGKPDVARVLQSHRGELRALADAVTAPNARLSTTAIVAYPGDRMARVVVEDGRYRVASAGAFPAAAVTPRDALRELGEVLERRSMAGLLRVLSRDSRQVLEATLRSLVEALREPSSVEVDREGRRATAHLPGGHTVRLEREDGVWRVKDFN